jgi:DNA-binding transcriptional MerR regulator
MPASRDVQVDWKRLWDRGERVNAPVRSTRLTITRGARMPLDTFVETEGVPEALANRYPPGHPDLEQARRVSESCKGAAFTLSVGLESEDPAITTARTPRDAVSLAKLKEQLETMSKTLSEKASSLAGPDASLTLAQKTEMQRFVQEQLAEVQRQLRELQNALSAQQRSVAVETARQRLQTMAAARTRATEVRAVKVAGSSGDVEAAMLSARVCASSGPELPNTIRVVGKDGKCVGTMLDDVDQSRLQSGDFDLWLVHTWAGGPAEAQYLKLSVKPLDGKFSFPPMVVESNGQPVNVEVRGYVQVYSLATTPNSAVAPSTVAVGIGRTVTAADKRVIAAGVTSREVTTARVAAAKPGVVSRVGSGASDVISLELPDDTPGLEGHQFSVRVRVPRSTTP